MFYGVIIFHEFMKLNISKRLGGGVSMYVTSSPLINPYSVLIFTCKLLVFLVDFISFHDKKDQFK